MKETIIEATRKTPYLRFSPATGVFEMKGRSIPENTYEFYSGVIKAVDEYLLSPGEDALLRFELDYFNTSSSKFLIDILKKFKAAAACGNINLKIEWRYEDGDDEMMETGRDFMELIEYDFEIIKIDER